MAFVIIAMGITTVLSLSDTAYPANAETVHAAEVTETKARTFEASGNKGSVHVTLQEEKDLIEQEQKQLALSSVTGRSHKNSTCKSIRNYAKYHSDTAVNRLSGKKREFFDKLDRMAMEYLTTTKDAVYLTTEEVSDDFMKGVDFSGLTEADALDVMELFMYSRPEYYFLDTNYVSSPNKIWIHIFDFAIDGEDRQVITNKVFHKIDDWVRLITDDETSLLQTELSAHDLIVERVEFGRNDYDQSIYSVLFEDKSVCAGYAKTFALLMNACNADTIILYSDSHAWNAIQLADSGYYCVDVTWDDSLDSYDYFNISDENTRRKDSKINEHTILSYYQAMLPVIADSDYIPTEKDIYGDPDYVLDGDDFETDDEEELEEDIQPVSRLNFSKRIKNGIIKVSWKKVPNAVKYQLQGSWDKTFGIKFSVKTDSTSQKVKNMETETRYYFRIRAIDKNNRKSEWYTVRVRY